MLARMLVVLGDGVFMMLLIFLLVVLAVPATFLLLVSAVRSSPLQPGIAALGLAAGIWIAALIAGTAAPLNNPAVVELVVGVALTFVLVLRGRYQSSWVGWMLLVALGPPGSVVLLWRGYHSGRATRPGGPSLNVAVEPAVADPPVLTRPSSDAFARVAGVAVILGASSIVLQSHTITGSLEFLVFAGLAIWVRQRESYVAVAAGIAILALDVALLFFLGDTTLPYLALRLVLIGSLVRALLPMWRERSLLSAAPAGRISGSSVSPPDLAGASTLQLVSHLGARFGHPGWWLALGLLVIGLLVLALIMGAGS